MAQTDKQAKVTLIFGHDEGSYKQTRDAIQELQSLIGGLGGGGSSQSVGRAAPKGGAIPAPQPQTGGGMSSPMFGPSGSPWGPTTPSSGYAPNSVQSLYITAQTVYIEAKGAVSIDGGGMSGMPGGGTYGNSPGAPIPAPQPSSNSFGWDLPTFGREANPTLATIFGRPLGLGANQMHQMFGQLPGMSSLLDMTASAAPFIGAGAMMAGAYNFSGAAALSSLQLQGLQANDIAGSLGGGGGSRAYLQRAMQSARMSTGWSAMSDTLGSVPIVGQMLNLPMRLADQAVQTQMDEITAQHAMANSTFLWGSSVYGGEAVAQTIQRWGNKHKASPLGILGGLGPLAPFLSKTQRDPYGLQMAEMTGAISKGLGMWGGMAANPEIQGALQTFGDADTVLAQYGWLNTLTQFSNMPGVMGSLLSGNLGSAKGQMQSLLPSLALSNPLAALSASTSLGMSGPAIQKLMMPATQLNYQSQMLGYSGSIAGSQIAYGQAMGFSAGQMVPLIGNSIANIDSQISVLEAKMAMAGSNELDRQMYRAQIEGLRAQRAQASYQQAALPGQQAMGLAGASMTSASAMTTIQMYRGTPAMSNSGFRQQMAGIDQMSQAIDLALSNPQLGPVERAQLLAQKTQLEAQRIEIPRQQVMMAYGERTSAASVAGADVQYSISKASMFGTPGDIAGARRQQLDVIGQQINAEEQLLADLKRVGGSIREMNEIQARIKTLKTQQMTEQEQINRDEASQRGQLYATSGATAGAKGSLAYNAYGSERAMGYNQESISQSRMQLTTLRNEKQRALAAGADPNGQYIRGLDLQEQQLSNQIVSSESELANFRGDPGLRRAERQNQLYGALVTRTFSGYGDVRGFYEGNIALNEQKAAGLTRQRDKALAGASSDASRTLIQERYEQQMQELALDTISNREQLERGWQERLISSVVGAPSSFNMVASRFTQMEATAGAGIINRAFGGSYDQMRYHKDKGGLWMNSYIGAIGRPEGFAATAMNDGMGMISPLMPPSMNGGGADGGLEVAGKIDVTVRVIDQNGNPMGSQVDQMQVLRSLGNQAQSTYRSPAMSR